jgi:uncharacterized membrane protein YraQ (UPF0718 family)
MLATFLTTALGYLREVAEIIVLGFVVAGVITAVVNKEAVARHLGGGNLLLSNLLGATIGVVTPLCCCSAIPTAMALYRSGSRRGPACAFLIATPWFNWYGLTALNAMQLRQTAMPLCAGGLAHPAVWPWRVPQPRGAP